MKYILILRSGIAYGPFDSHEAAGQWAVTKGLAPGWRITHIYSPEVI